MAIYRVAIRMLVGDSPEVSPYTYTRVKFRSEVEARAYARWLLSRNPNRITAARIEKGLGKANASFLPSRAKGSGGGRVVFWDDQPGDELSIASLSRLDRARRLLLPLLQDGVSVSESSET